MKLNVIVSEHSMSLSNKMNIQQLRITANSIRKRVVEMLMEAGSGHPGGSLGMADVFTALYFSILQHDPKKPDWVERDRVILSNGHIVPVWYSTLAEAGYFSTSELSTLRKIGSRLQGHPHFHSLPGIENTSGPLGQGISQAVGLAKAFQMDQKTQRAYCIVSDGEQQEGQTWEAYMFAGAHHLSNLTVLMDRNHIQIEGSTEDILDIEPLREKLEAFNWHVIEIDGHDFEEIIDACLDAKEVHSKPTMIICNTIPGKGVSFMENDYKWHGKKVSREEGERAVKELRGQK